jgi:hypothetical protein
VVAVPASVQDLDTLAVIEPELAGSSLLKVWADLAFNGGEPDPLILPAVGDADSVRLTPAPRRP